MSLLDPNGANDCLDLEYEKFQIQRFFQRYSCQNSQIDEYQDDISIKSPHVVTIVTPEYSNQYNSCLDGDRGDLIRTPGVLTPKLTTSHIVFTNAYLKLVDKKWIIIPYDHNNPIIIKDFFGDNFPEYIRFANATAIMYIYTNPCMQHYPHSASTNFGWSEC